MSNKLAVEYPDIMDFHSPAFEEQVEFAFNFASALSIVASPVSLGRIAIIAETDVYGFKEAFGIERSNIGGMFVQNTFFGEHNEMSVFVFDKNTGNPRSDRAALIMDVVHELVHSLTVNSKEKFHRFLEEIIAGLGEVELLGSLVDRGERVAPSENKLVYLPCEDSVLPITVPAEAMPNDARENCASYYTSAGAIGAASFLKGLEIAGLHITSREIIGLSGPGETAGGDLIKQALGELQPGLPEAIDAVPQIEPFTNTKALHLLQSAIRSYDESY